MLAPFIDSVPRKLSRNTSDGAFLEILKRDPLQAERTPVRWVVALRRWLARVSPPRTTIGITSKEAIGHIVAPMAKAAGGRRRPGSLKRRWKLKVIAIDAASDRTSSAG